MLSPIDILAFAAGAVVGGIRAAGVAGARIVAAKRGGKWTKEVVERSSRGTDGATSRHIIEKLDGKTNSVTHPVAKDGKVIHQHQTNVGKHGTTRQFPDSDGGVRSTKKSRDPGTPTVARAVRIRGFDVVVARF